MLLYYIMNSLNKNIKEKMNNIIDYLMNTNIKTIKEDLTYIISDNNFCDEIVGEGHYGYIIKSNNNNYVKIKIKDKKMKFPVVVKNMKSSENSKIGIIIENNILYIHSYTNFMAETLILIYLRKLWFKTVNLPLIVNYMSCYNDFFNKITLVKYGLNKKYYIDISKNIYNDEIFVIKPELPIYNSYITTLKNLLYYIMFKSNDEKCILPNNVECNLVELIDNITLVYLINYHFLRINNVFIKDIHLNNIFINWLNEDYYFDDKNLKNIKYIYYKVGEKYYKVKNSGFLIVIGDFGHSIVKLKNDIIIVGNLFEKQYNEVNFEMENEFRNVEFLQYLARIIPFDIYKKCLFYNILSNKPYSSYFNESYFNLKYIKECKKTIELLEYFKKFQDKYVESKDNILIDIKKYY